MFVKTLPIMKSKIVMMLFLVMTGMTVNLCAQEAKQNQDEIGKQRLRDGLARGQRNRALAIATPVAGLNVEDTRYNHKEKEIMAKLNTDGIPADFPMYKSEYSNKEYDALMNKWYEENPALLKPKKQ
jgi:hypothetical protein